MFLVQNTVEIQRQIFKKIAFMKPSTAYAKVVLFAFFLFGLNSCATYHEQLGKDFENYSVQPELNSEITNEIVLVGDVGTNNNVYGNKVLTGIQHYLKASNTPKTLLFLGNNVSNEGISSPQNIEILNQQIKLATLTNGKTYFLPGTNDWAKDERLLTNQKKYIANKLNKTAYLPPKHQAISEVEITPNCVVLAIDSEWFMQDWNKHNTINEDSFIKNREDFFEEFSRLINKNQNKITVVAMHHPIVTNGEKGGYFSIRDHIYPYKKVPFPIAGTFVNFLRKTSGASVKDTQFTLYRNFIDRLETITKNQEQIVFVGAHENSLQYIETNGIKQIVSGAAAMQDEARSVQHKSFTVGKLGFATLKITNDNKVKVQLYTVENDKNILVFEKLIMQPDAYEKKFNDLIETTINTSVFPDKSLKKSETYTFLFGDHYRDLYATKLQTPVANFDTLYGGLKPVFSYADNKSVSLVLENPHGKQYLLKRLRKSSKQFLQSAIFKNTYVQDKLSDTYVVNFFDDYYTTTHPFAPLVLAPLQTKAGLHTANPKLYFVPKQNALGKYNETYGNELYLIEERPDESQKSLPTFGNGSAIITTQELLTHLEKDANFKVDTQMYLRARLFDFLIGDWDRNPNQWFWIEKCEGKSCVYQPISRDHDQAFAKIDGQLLSLLNRLNPLKHIQNYKEKYPNPRWITKSAFPLDRFLLQNTTLTDWEKEANALAKLLNDDAIYEAFNYLPAEVKQKYTQQIISTLKQRRNNLTEFSKKYYTELFKIGTIVGTNKNDVFTINTQKDGITVQKVRLNKTDEPLITNYTYQPAITKELWIYGLDGEDVFKVIGNKTNTRLKIIGGRNNDEYIVQTKKHLKIFDYLSQQNTFTQKNNGRTILKDQYAINQFDFRKAPLNVLTIVPDAGYNRDNGVILGLNGAYTINKFNQNPYSQKHQFKVKYSFENSGLFAAYTGSFKNYSNNGYWVFDALATSANFTKNFFGITNVAAYDRHKFKQNYYRVRTSQFDIKPGYEWKGRNGSSFLINATYESVKIEETNNRIVDEYLQNNQFETYLRTNFIGSSIKYKFENYNNGYEPTTGLGFMLLFGSRFFTDDFQSNHQYLNSKLNFVVPLSKNKKVTWSSTYYLEKIFGDKYHFYQATTIGANNGLRGYRMQRFLGNSSFVTSNDIRFKMNEIENSFLPMSYGIYMGYDTGRVWNKNTTSKQWYYSYGLGFWLNAIDSFSAHAGIFTSKEEPALVTFGIGFSF